MKFIQEACHALNYMGLDFRLRLVVLNANFHNILIIWWRSILLVEETRVHGENHRPVASH